MTTIETLQQMLMEHYLKEDEREAIQEAIATLRRTDQSALYDAEKVVEELVKNSEQIDEFDEYNNKKLVLITRRIVDIRKAIDIVRGGSSNVNK